MAKAVWPDCEAEYEGTFDEKNVHYTMTVVNSQMNKVRTWNLQGQGNRQRSRWKELMKVNLHLMCERVIVIDHGEGTMKLYANYTFDLETWNIQGQSNTQRSQWKELIKVYLHLKC